MLIRVRNLLTDTAPYTNLTQTEAIGTATLHVKNANSFVAQWAIQLGNTGEEQSEIILLSGATPSGTTLASSGTTIYSHPTDTPVYAVKFNQLVISRATAGTSGTVSALATVSITPDGTVTTYDDTSGATTYAYKAQYYNSTIGTASSYSDWITPAGDAFYSLSKIRSRIKNKLLNAGFIGTDDVIDEWINEYLEMMTNAVIDVDKDYAIGTTNVSFSGTADQGTITATDFKQVKRAWITYSGGTDQFEMSAMSLIGYKPGQVFSNQVPKYYFQGDNIFGRQPAADSGTVNILYYKLNPVLVNDGDNLPVPMRGYTNGFVNYALAQAYYKDSKPDQGQIKEGVAMNTLNKFVNESTPRTKSGASYIDIIESIDPNLEPFV